jgi:hypothetical protein
MPKIRITAIREYGVDPEHYPDCKNVKEMIEVDRESAIEILMYGTEDASTKITMEEC